MMKQILILISLLIFTSTVTSASTGDGGYTFLVNGKQADLSIEALDGGFPKAGDVFRVWGLRMVLGPPGIYSFETTEDKDGRLFQLQPDGKKTVVGVSISRGYVGDVYTVFNPLTKLSKDELKMLRGIHLDAWTKEISSALSEIDPAHCFLSLTDRVAENDKQALPELLSKLHYLKIEALSGTDIESYDSLKLLRSLRFFELQSRSSQAFDCTLISENSEMLWLSISGVNLQHASTLARLSELKVLSLDECDKFSDLSFAASLAELVELSIPHSAVTDLGPLGGLKSLRRVKANSSKISRLPVKAMPALKELDILSTSLTDELVATFQKSNPTCAIRHRWAKVFQESVRGTTRIRVRSQGTCHRNPNREKTLFEVTDLEAIHRVVNSLDIDEASSGQSCMCCGDPSIEFYKGDKLLHTLGYHHGFSLRWPGNWPGDGVMTRASQIAMNSWLAANGVSGPQEQQQENMESEQATNNRITFIENNIPEMTMEGLRNAKSEEDAVAAFEEGIPDPVDRAILYLRIFGCDQAHWNLRAVYDNFLMRTLLAQIDGELLAQAFAKIGSDSKALNGAARWLLHEKKWDLLSAQALEKHLAQIARFGLGHPRQHNRIVCIKALHAIGTGTAKLVLTELVVGSLEIRRLKPEESGEPAGTVVVGPGDSEPGQAVSDRVYAAFVLAKLGEKAILPSILGLKKDAGAEDLELLEQAENLLE